MQSFYAIATAILALILYLLGMSGDVKHDVDIIRDSIPKDVVGYGKMPKKVKHWYDYDKWDHLFKDAKMYSEYKKDLIKFEELLESDTLDWTESFKSILPKLNEKVEYVGVGIIQHNKIVLNYQADGHATVAEDGMFKVDNNIFNTVKSKPGLFMYHTHPNISIFTPSHYDISTAIELSSTLFTYHVIYSSKGVFIYRISKKMFTQIMTNVNKNRIKDLYRLHIAAISLPLYYICEPLSINDFIKLYQMFGINIIFKSFNGTNVKEKIIFPSGDSNPIKYQYLIQRWQSIVSAVNDHKVEDAMYNIAIDM